MNGEPVPHWWLLVCQSPWLDKAMLIAVLLVVLLAAALGKILGTLAWKF